MILLDTSALIELSYGTEIGRKIKSIEIEKELSKKGQIINKLDIFIAAVAINQNATLVSLDKHFANIKQLKSKLF